MFETLEQARAKYAVANTVVNACQDALLRLVEHESSPEFTAAADGWSTIEDRDARMVALHEADAWPVSPTQVTVSACRVDEASARLSGTLGTVAQKAADAAGLETFTVTRISPYAYSIKW
jgi:hypothetical protein